MRDRHNNAKRPERNKSKSGTRYAGNARFIEIGSPGIPFRYTINIDHIDAIRFEEWREEQVVLTPGGTGVEATFDDAGAELMPAVPPPTHKEMVQMGWTVVVIQNSAQNGINFSDIGAAMGCYNRVLGMIRAVGAPHVFMGSLRPPPLEKPEIDGVDAEAIEDAVDAADLDSENDDAIDEEFELTDEDIALLEHPEIDVDAIEETFEDKSGEPNPHEEPTKN